MDLDGAGFDADAYFNSIMDQQSLPELVELENRLVAETKTLDSDMQNLVHMNYSKFISATDTIRKMSTDVEAMEEQMESLAAKVEGITSCSEEIVGTLAPNREAVTRLTRVHGLVTRLQFLFELPARLEQSVALQADSQAVGYWLKAKPVLEEHRHLESFAKIEKECLVVMDALKIRTREKLKADDQSFESALESASSLVQLGDSPMTVRGALLRGRFQQLESRLAHVVKVAEEANEGDDPMTLHGFMAQLHAHFVSRLILLAEAYMDMFGQGPGSGPARLQLGEMTRDVMARYIGVVKERLMQGTTESVDLVHALTELRKDLRSVDAKVPEVGVSDRLSDLVTAAGHRLVQTHLDGLTSRLLEYVGRLGGEAETAKGGRRQHLDSSVKPRFGSLPLDIAKRMTRAIDQTIENITPLFNQQSDVILPHRDAFVAKLLIGMQTVLLGLYETITAFTDPHSQSQLKPPSGAAGALFLLFLSRLCDIFSTSTVDAVSRSLVRAVSDSSSDPGLLFNSSELTRRASDASKQLLQHYVEAQGRSLSRMFRSSVESRQWLKGKEPREARPVIGLILDELSLVEHDTQALYGRSRGVSSAASGLTATNAPMGTGIRGPGSDSGTRSSRAPSVSARSGDRGGDIFAAELSIGKLFEKKVEIFGPVSPEPFSILTGIVKIALKSLIEMLRLQSYSRHGFQQVQVDVYELRLRLPGFVEADSARLLHTLLDETLQSAADRCVDPVSMDQSLVEKIVSS